MFTDPSGYAKAFSLLIVPVLKKYMVFFKEFARLVCLRNISGMNTTRELQKLPTVSFGTELMDVFFKQRCCM